MQPERKAIIYTDPGDSDFQRPDGKVLLKCRTVQFKDGRIIDHGWMFKEKAIEPAFDKLNLKDQQKDSDEAILVNALLSSQLSAGGEGQDKNKVGQILVEIRRVKVGPRYIDSKYKTRFKEGQYDDVDTSELQGDITHRTGFVRKATLSRYEVENPRIVEYRPWRSGEGLYASFLFFYRSRGKSLRLHLFRHFNLHNLFYLLVHELSPRSKKMTKHIYRPTRKIRLPGLPTLTKCSQEGQAFSR